MKPDKKQDRAISQKHRRFVEEYFKTGNLQNSALAAGYSKKSAHVQAHWLIKRPKVKAYLDQLRKEASEASQVTVEFILNGLKENLRRALQLKEVEDKDGNPIGEFVWHGQTANRALELLGKHLGMFPDKVDHTGMVNHEHTFHVTVEQKERLRSAIYSRLGLGDLGALGGGSPLGNGFALAGPNGVHVQDGPAAG